MILTYKGDLNQISQLVLQNSLNANKFKQLFDSEDLKKTTRKYLNDSKIDDEVDTELLNKWLNRVEKDIVKGLTTRCMWAEIKKIKSGLESDKMALRAKLKIYHMSQTKRYSSLQTQ